VLTSPARFVQVVTTIASGGQFAPNRWIRDPAGKLAPPLQVIPRAAANELANAMREAVRAGTGRTLASNPIAIAGKTGTAELDGRPSHSWFAGYAPYGAKGRRIAFVVLVENGGYGARAAAPLAGAIVDLARQLRIIQQDGRNETPSSASHTQGH
jgi:peptidoglycan glycosyltransferase